MFQLTEPGQPPGERVQHKDVFVLQVAAFEQRFVVSLLLQVVAVDPEQVVQRTQWVRSKSGQRSDAGSRR
jgi:hypothetical protein